MKRRDFIKKVAIGSTCAFAGVTLLKNDVLAQTKPSYKYKITVVGRLPYKDGKLCPYYKDNQEFTTDAPWIKPKGFCNDGWEDLQKGFQEIYEGKTDVTVCRCTGFSPVDFKIEKVKN